MLTATRHRQVERVERVLGGRAYVAPCRGYVVLELDRDDRRICCHGAEIMEAVVSALEADESEDMDVDYVTADVTLEGILSRDAIGTHYGDTYSLSLEDADVSHVTVRSRHGAIAIITDGDVLSAVKESLGHDLDSLLE